MMAALPLAAQVVITTPQSSITVGTVGSAYTPTVQFQATTGGVPGTYNWIITSGVLPYGLSLSMGGLLSGTPEGCPNFWTGNTPCNFGDVTATCGNNTFNPMACPITVRAQDTSTHGTGTKNFTVSAYWTPQLGPGAMTYLTTQYANFSLMSQSAGLSVPPIAGGGHLVIANPIFRNAAYDNLPAWNAWIDAMRAAGMSIVNIEVDLECVLVNRTPCLNLYAGAIDHAHRLGMTVSLNPAFYTTATPTTPSCGDDNCPGNGTPGGIGGACALSAALNHPINNTHFTAGSVTYGSGVTDWYNCLVNTVMLNGGTLFPYQYMLQTWLHSGDRFVPVHEPTTQAIQWGEGINSTSYSGCSSNPGSVPSQTCGGQSGGLPTPTSNVTCPQDWANYFLTPFFTALTSWTRVPSHIVYGVTFNAREMATASGSVGGYYTQLSNAVIPATADMGLDMYDFDSQRQMEYTSTIQTFQGMAGGNAHSVFVEEFGPQAWNYTPTTGSAPSGEPCAIVGLQSCTWSTFNQDFFPSLLSFLAAQGVTDASLYGTEILGACASTYPDNGQDTNTLTNVTTAMQNHQYSLSGARMSAILSNWNKTSLQGCSLVGGSLAP